MLFAQFRKDGTYPSRARDVSNFYVRKHWWRRKNAQANIFANISVSNDVGSSKEFLLDILFVHFSGRFADIQLEFAANAKEMLNAIVFIEYFYDGDHHHHHIQPSYTVRYDGTKLK